MKILQLLTFTAVVGLALPLGCGGDGGGTCANASACGGDLVGTWSITSSCISMSGTGFVDDCPTASFEGVDLKITGSATYRADLTYSSTTTLSGAVAITFPAACLTFNGVTATCAQVQEALTSSPDDFTSASCKTAASAGCTCTVGLPAEMSTDSGTYTTTAAGQLTETPTDEEPDQSGYCVKGDTLTTSPRALADMMGASVSGTITAKKQ